MKAIITDLDGVIRYFPPQRNSEFETRYGLPQGTLLHTAFGYPDLNQVITGKITDHEWRSNISSRIQEFLPAQDSMKLIRDWSSFPGIINYEILDLYTSYRDKGTKLALLTNATNKLTEDLSTHSISNVFDYIINSSSLGLMKPNPGIFHFALKTLGIKPSEAVYIDDSHTHSAAASRIGLKSHLFKDFQNLADFLKQNFS
ncbi:HAD-IA family hydrolase [Candidatus Lokiarchaeum ossiferum]|uniref:HAD-IA family hydrolase n=1 Tax=Candidatus Lokiarchaeum ossiferum TaxID=2951803 RepID=UPI00352E4365